MIELGIDRLIQTASLSLGRQRWGLVTNDAVTTQHLIPVRHALLSAGFNLVRLFSPEHGLAALGADGASMPHQLDPLTGLPVFSLYGETLHPPHEWLHDLDGILFDLPDIGLRFYTYMWTLSYLMEACNELGLPLWVLDRPNPISGNLHLAEGPFLVEASCSSFIGRWALPIRTSLSIGELALYWQQTRGFKALPLEVVCIAGWSRGLFFKDLNLPFVPPSPAIASPETFLTYPALCFLESLNVSEGRGTAFPFRVCGAPFLKRFVLAEAFNAAGFAGVSARPLLFTPLQGRHAQETCEGIMLHVTDPLVYRPIQTGLGLIALLHELYPHQIAWASYPTRANPSGTRHFDLLVGDPALRIALAENPSKFRHHLTTFTTAHEWEAQTMPFQLYS